MSNRIHALAQQLTGKQKLEDCSLEEVKRIAQRYPYFAPAQFLLLHKLRQSDLPEEADAQNKKAILFYPDPLQFEFFISSAKYNVEDDLPEAQIPVSFSAEPEVEDRSAGDEAALTQVDNGFDKTDIEYNVSTATTPTDNETEVIARESIHLNDNKNQEPGEAETEHASDILKEMPQGDTVQDSSAGVENVSLVIEAKASESDSSLNADKLDFEPYHTVDYFASQGIKISPDELTKDKLSKQLKSFTEWLKTMKRLPAAPIGEASKNTVDKNIESLADRSITGSDVVTEAMAEVWAKQGNAEKALDIYNKLVLLNPSKKAYFASKIENLKQS